MEVTKMWIFNFIAGFAIGYFIVGPRSEPTLIWLKDKWYRLIDWIKSL